MSSWNTCQRCGEEDSSVNSRNGGMGFRYCDSCYRKIMEDRSDPELIRYANEQERGREYRDRILKEEREKEYERTHCEDCGEEHSNDHTNHLCTSCYNEKYGSRKERCVKCGSKNDNNSANWCSDCVRKYRKELGIIK